MVIRSSGVEREPAVGVLEEQPDLLERVPVVLGAPQHRLPGRRVAAVRLEVELGERQRTVAVVPVGARRVVGEPVDRDAHEVSGDRLRAGVVERPPDHAPVDPVLVRERRHLLLDDQPGAGRHPLLRDRRVAQRRLAGRAGVPHIVVVLEAQPDRAARAEHRLGPAGEVFRGAVPPALDVTHVRRVEAHLRGELLLRQPPLQPPPGELGRELVGGLFNWGRGSCRGARHHVPRWAGAVRGAGRFSLLSDTPVGQEVACSRQMP